MPVILPVQRDPRRLSHQPERYPSVLAAPSHGMPRRQDLGTDCLSGQRRPEVQLQVQLQAVGMGCSQVSIEGKEWPYPRAEKGVGRSDTSNRTAGGLRGAKAPRWNEVRRTEGWAREYWHVGRVLPYSALTGGSEGTFSSLEPWLSPPLLAGYGSSGLVQAD